MSTSLNALVRRLTIIEQHHEKVHISEGMKRPLRNLADALALRPIVITVVSNYAKGQRSNVSTKSINIPQPNKNIAFDFLLGMFGRYRKARKAVETRINERRLCIVAYRASPLLISGAILLKSDLFSTNYRRRFLFAVSKFNFYACIEAVKFVLATIQEFGERLTYSQILLHSALEVASSDRYTYLPIITSQIQCRPSDGAAVHSGRILVVGYQFYDPIANADSDEILSRILAETVDPDRVFYLGWKSHKINDENQTEWVDDYQAFLREFAVAVYARRACSGAHNKIVDLLMNGCVVYCSKEMKSAFAAPCHQMRPLDAFSKEVGQSKKIQYQPQTFRQDVNEFFNKEFNIYKKTVRDIEVK